MSKFAEGTLWKIVDVNASGYGSVWKADGVCLVCVKSGGTSIEGESTLSIFNRSERAWRPAEDPFVTFVREVLNNAKD